MSLLPPERGCRVALIVVVAMSIGVTVGALLGCLIGYWYVDPFWSRPPEGTSTVQPLRESIAAFSALIGVVIGAPVGGVVGCIAGAIASVIQARIERSKAGPPQS